MKSINDLLKKHPDLYKKLNSEQRNLSKQLLKIRLKKQKNVTEFSKMLGISEKKYLEFEFGDMHIPVAEYNKLLKQVENLSYKDSMNFTIFDVINTVLKRKAEINIKYDEDLNLYFFVIKTTSELFSSDYDVLDTLDNVLSDYKYMGKSVVATLGE
ncbi:hypothetical protein [Enterococcus faecium]|uniref:hypothetical protein n=1 Tax=Enterococcus faecium TaxID=1352 RepID=UPI003D68889B